MESFKSTDCLVDIIYHTFQVNTEYNLLKTQNRSVINNFTVGFLNVLLCKNILFIHIAGHLFHTVRFYEFILRLTIKVDKQIAKFVSNIL